MVPELNVVSISISLSGLWLCLLGILHVHVSKLADHAARKYFLLSYVTLFLFDGSNLAGQLMRGQPGAVFRAGLYVSNFIEFLSPVVLVYIVTVYLLYLVDPKRERITMRTLFFALVAANTILLIISQFTGLYYVIDGDNVYHRSGAYALSYILPLVMMGADISLLVKEKDRLSEKEILAFSLYFVIPVAAMLLQLFIYGVYPIVFATIVAAFTMYVFILSDETERYSRQVEENAGLRGEIMLSQIQPHFLYNSLGAIRRLCRSDQEAAEAIGRFASYLRGNMESITRREPIPFTTELEHTRAYLDLEQLRFGEDLRVVYDLETTDFLVPALSLQPLAENAVRHGVRGKESGRGIVTITTREREDRFLVTVADDGPGFDPRTRPEDGQAHIGLDNVRERLRRMSGGTLDIVSSPGKGTRVTMTLPKEDPHADIRH